MNATTGLKFFGHKIASLSIFSILLFSGFLFFYLIPIIEATLIQQKKEMLSAVTQTVMNIFEEQQKKVLLKEISLDDAKSNTINLLKSYRYGPQHKNYFWINDRTPNMIMHPFRPDLENSNLSDYVDPKGTLLTVLATGQAILDAEKHIKFFDLILHDVTDQKYTQEEYLKSEKLNSIGTLAGGIAHDFNNILTGLYGNIALAKLDLPPDNDAIQYIEDAEHSMTRATELTQQLLTFASGGDPIKESIPIYIVIKDVANFNLSGSNIKLMMNMDQQLWTVRADKEQLSQVISNLVINGRQAMPDGGVLNILVRNTELKKNEILSLNAGKYIKIGIQDEGTGISKDYISKIFDPYFTTKQAGCGMGLATAYSILKKHNGLITVVSEIGKGSEFNIYLPAYDAEQNRGRTSKRDNLNSSTAKILIMDDDEQVCHITGKMIERFGYTACSVPNGELALNRYKQEMRNNNKYDIVLMDLTIPGGMGGKEAIIKLLEIDPDAKVIVISGYSNDPVLSNFADYGFKGMLVKPFKIEALKQTLDQVFG